jgi:lambda repressor-like predicted transcriptional regulator
LEILHKLARKPLIHSDPLVDLLGQITSAGKKQGMTAAAIAVRAGLAPETLSRMKARKSADFGAVERMAAVVGLQLTLVSIQTSRAERVSSGSFFD